jgi:hypothetical protein
MIEASVRSYRNEALIAQVWWLAMALGAEKAK